MKGLIVYSLIFWVSQFLICADGRKKPKFVTTSIDARWNQAPLILEISEFLADENINSFWAFLDDVSSLETPLSTLGEFFFFFFTPFVQ